MTVIWKVHHSLINTNTRDTFAVEKREIKRLDVLDKREKAGTI